MRIPDFFMVGAPKCGTTAMCNYLGQHPDIFMAWTRGRTGGEIHFFGSDLDFPGRLRVTETEYRVLFATAKNEIRIGERSNFYLASKCAAREIKAFSPSARIIIMLRNPVDMLYALHGQLLYNGLEQIRDFEEALRTETDRRPVQSPWIFRGNYVNANLYREVGRYYSQVQRYFEIFGRESVHVILFDDFKAATERVYRETLRFLEVNETFQPDFPVINPSRRFRIRFLRVPPSYLRRLAKILTPQPLRRVIRRTVSRLNTVYEARRPLDPQVRRRLQTALAAEIEQLSKLLGRDLGGWLENH